MDQLVGPLAQYGLAGIVIAALALTCRRLFDLYTTSQEKRIEEAGAYKLALLDVTNQLKVMTETIQAVSRTRRAGQ